MQVDWFTVIAQIINFFVLVWLMKRFLYKPVLAAIEEREKKIAGELQDADKKVKEALQEKESFVQKNIAFDKEKDAAMNKAVADAEQYRQKLLEQARTAGADMQAKLTAELQSQQQRLAENMAHKTKQQVFEIASKTLGDLASTTLEAEVSATFIQKLNALNEEDKRTFVGACTAANTVKIKSAFAMPALQRNAIQQAINSTAGISAAYEYETDSALITGIEISTGSYKLGWNTAAYLDSLQKQLETVLIENI